MQNNFVEALTENNIQLLLPLMRQYYQFEGLVFHEPQAQETVRQMLQQQRGMGWLVINNNFAIGYAVIVFGFSLEYGGITAELDELFVEPEFRGLGLGKKLLQHAIETCENMGLVMLSLETLADNKTARNFYSRFGFKEVSRVFMRKVLSIKII